MHLSLPYAALSPFVKILVCVLSPKLPVKGLAMIELTKREKSKLSFDALL